MMDRIINKLKNKLRPKIILNKKLNIAQDPLPLIDINHKIGLLWSPKAGCTFALKWFLFQTNQLDKAIEYDPWVHNYRIDKIQNTPKYWQLLNTVNQEEISFIKFVRNPFSRAVSSFFHVLMLTENNDPRMSVVKEQTLKIFFPTSRNSLSFRQFIEVLNNIDLNQIDTHIRHQFHPFETELKNPINIIKIEESKHELPKLETKLNLKLSDINQFKNSFHHKNTSLDSFEFTGDQMFKNTKNVPPYRCFYDDELIKKVSSIYASDFKEYKYSNSIL